MSLLNKIGDKLFMLTDRFFQGNRTVEHCSAMPELDRNGNYIVWELNQGVEDILIKDIRISVNCIIPALIRKPLEKIYRNACLYFLVDAVIEDETIDPEADKASRLNVLPKLAEKKIVLTPWTNKGLQRNILSFQEWFKINLQKARRFFRHQGTSRTFYLLGNFAPSGNDCSFNGLNYILRDPDKTNFKHTFIFHKRN
jgi:hypothetical protein